MNGLDGLTELYFRWERFANKSTTASGMGLKINGFAITHGSSWIPIAKEGGIMYGYSRAHYNGLTWELLRTTGANSASNVSPVNPQTVFNELLDVGPCNSLSIVFPATAYRPNVGLLQIYGAK